MCCQWGGTCGAGECNTRTQPRVGSTDASSRLAADSRSLVPEDGEVQEGGQEAGGHLSQLSQAVILGDRKPWILGASGPRSIISAPHLLSPESGAGLPGAVEAEIYGLATSHVRDRQDDSGCPGKF